MGLVRTTTLTGIAAYEAVGFLNRFVENKTGILSMYIQSKG